MRRVLAMLLCLAFLAGVLLAGIERRQLRAGLSRAQARLRALRVCLRPLESARVFLVQGRRRAVWLLELLTRFSGGKSAAVFLSGGGE